MSRVKMTLTQAYVAALPTPTLRQIVEDYDQFERDGYIGESALRTHATEILNQLDSGASIVRVMENLAFEAHRHFANLYLRRGVK